MFMHTTSDISNAQADQATQTAEQLVKSTRQLTNGLLEGVRGGSHQLRVKAEHASDHTMRYVQHEPISTALSTGCRTGWAPYWIALAWSTLPHCNDA